MRQLGFILLTMAILSCNDSHKKSDFYGTWFCVSSVDLETQEIMIPEGEEKLVVEFKSDSIYVVYQDESYAWEVKGDSLLLGDNGSVYIKEITAKSLIVELDVFGMQRLSFVKIK